MGGCGSPNFWRKLLAKTFVDWPVSPRGLHLSDVERFWQQAPSGTSREGVEPQMDADGWRRRRRSTVKQQRSEMPYLRPSAINVFQRSTRDRGRNQQRRDAPRDRFVSQIEAESGFSRLRRLEIV